MKTVVQQVHLEQRHGSIDKVYVVTLHAEGSGFSVLGENARRGSTLIPRPQTKSPVSREVAQGIFDRLVKKKVGEGYKYADGSDIPASVTSLDAADADLDAPPMQLLTPVESEAETLALLADDRFLAQRKYDAKRLNLVKVGTRIVGFNKKRQVRPVPVPVANALAAVQGDLVCDAEVYNAHAVIFDVQVLHGTIYRAQTCEARVSLIGTLVREASSSALREPETAIGRAAKQALYDRLQAECKEGIVFKERLAAYTDGRPNSGGPQRKRKFWKSLTAKVVSHHPTKSSIGIALRDVTGAWVGLGSVTVKPNQDTPAIGAYVEVGYLYGYRGGSLHVPELLADRSDEMDDADCSISQVVYKAEEAA